MADPGKPRGGFAALTALLKPGRGIVVQTHDFPDLDAVASAWGLAELLKRKGFEAKCFYRGRIRSRSLSRLVSELGVSVYNSLPALPSPQVIVVDGSPANGNVSLFEGELVGVIDHHCASAKISPHYLDLRPELAACSTIIEGYWEESREALPRDLATALITGLQSDTDFLSRRAAPEDFAAYARLFALGDFDRASRIVRTVFDLRELGLVTRALDGSVFKDGMFWAFLPGPCGQEVLAVLAEFALRTEEVRVAVVVERGENSTDVGQADQPSAQGIHVSVRSKDPGISAFHLVQKSLEGYGSGGGHSHSAGGFIPDATFPGVDALRDRFFRAVQDLSP